MNDLDIVKLLLAHGASYEIRNKVFFFLFLQIKKKQREEKNKKICSHSLLQEDLSCLDYAGANNFLEVLRELLKSGANVDQKDEKNVSSLSSVCSSFFIFSFFFFFFFQESTLMHYCARNNDIEQAKILLSYNANLSLLDSVCSLFFLFFSFFFSCSDLKIERSRCYALCL